MSKRILTFLLAVLMLVGSFVPVFAEDADVVVHNSVMTEDVDLGKREILKENFVDKGNGCLLYTSPSPRD